jgi:hypothetical protein
MAEKRRQKGRLLEGSKKIFRLPWGTGRAYRRTDGVGKLVVPVDLPCSWNLPCLARIFHDFDVIDQPFGFYRIIGGIVEADWGWSQQVFLRI